MERRFAGFRNDSILSADEEGYAMIRICLVIFACASALYAQPAKSVLLLAGKPSHGPGEHEFHAGVDLLAQALNESGLNLRVMVNHDTWPRSESLDGADVLVVYSDGNSDHPALGHEAELLHFSNEGKGIVFLHYAVDGMPGLLNECLMKVIGGYYDDEQSVNPVWTMSDPILARHPVTRGVHPFELKEEWYYKLKFSNITPVLQAVPPMEDQAQTLAWVYGENAFGFTGGHFHSSWAQPDLRKLVLNAIVWSAGLEVPGNGVSSDNPVIVKNKTMLHAIAKGDAADVHNHLLLGADVNETNKQGWTPLHFATVRGKTECARVLVEAGAALDPRTGTNKTPLHFAADRGFLEITKLLVENGADISAQDDEGWSPLHYAAEKNRVDVAAYLIELGAEVDLRSLRGGTPLHEASASAGPAMIQLLLDNGADRTITATNGKTPLDYALELGNGPAAALLN